MKETALGFALTSLLLLAVLFGMPAATAHAGFADFGDNDKSATEKTGDALLILLPLTALSATFALDDATGRVQFLKAFVANAAITQGLKWSITKDRPDGDCCNSFPSGHTSVAFQSAAFIHKRYGGKYGAPAYTAAALVAYTRIHADKHYIEDTIAGAAIGIITSRYFTTPYKNIVVTPVVSGGAYGVVVSGKW